MFRVESNPKSELKDTADSIEWLSSGIATVPSFVIGIESGSFSGTAPVLDSLKKKRRTESQKLSDKDAIELIEVQVEAMKTPAPIEDLEKLNYSLNELLEFLVVSIR